VVGLPEGDAEGWSVGAFDGTGTGGIVMTSGMSESVGDAEGEPEGEALGLATGALEGPAVG
jgi:hypothetical protein